VGIEIADDDVEAVGWDVCDALQVLYGAVVSPIASRRRL
jgi:hypothetical protein